MILGLTAHYLSSSICDGIAKPGDWVLIYAVGGGTGQWTAQMCKLRGFKVIGTTSKCKAEQVNDICDELIVLENEPFKSYADYASVDVVSKVMGFTNGQGCKLIIDGVGKATYEISLKCVARRGLFVSFGNASGAVPAFPVLKLLPKSAYVTRPKLNDYVSTREELLERAREVFEWVQQGKLQMKVDKVFPLEDVRHGHEYLESGGGSERYSSVCNVIIPLIFSIVKLMGCTLDLLLVLVPATLFIWTMKFNTFVIDVCIITRQNIIFLIHLSHLTLC